MLKKNRRLRTQLSLAMILTAITSLFIFIMGMVVFYLHLQSSWVNGLSQANQDTLNYLIANEEIDAAALTTLVSVFSFSWSGDYANQEVTALFVLTALAVVVATGIGVLFSRRISRPIETLTSAAHQVAGGAIDFQVDQTFTGSVEARDLFDSFNQMTMSLEQAERESTESAAAIAHELRTPLTILNGRLQGLRDGAFEPSEELLNALIAQVDTLSNIVTDLGALSKLGPQLVQLNLETVDLAKEISRVLMSVQPDLAREGIKLGHNLLPVLVRADAARIRQALNALIDNARQYAAQGEYLHVETFAQNHEAYIRITDKGPGIAQKDRKLVFDRWWRGGSSRSRASGGSGLGLSVVKAIIKAHDGTVRVEDGADSKGTAFVIALPIAPDVLTD